MDDSDGGTGEVANRCLEIWQEILDKSSIELKNRQKDIIEIEKLAEDKCL